MAQVRHAEITNTTNPAAIITVLPINVGQDYAFETLQRTFITAEIGTEAGQTQDTTSNPTTGFLFAQFQGAHIKNVVSLVLIKAAAATHTTVFNYFVYSDGTTPSAVDIGYRIDNTVKGQSSLWIIDSGTAAPGQIENGDKVIISLELGNT